MRKKLLDLQVILTGGNPNPARSRWAWDAPSRDGILDGKGTSGWTAAAYIVAGVGLLDSALLLFNKYPPIWILMTAAPWVGVWAAKRGRLEIMALCWLVTGASSYVLDPTLGPVIWALPWLIAPLALVPLVAHLRNRGH